MVGTCRSHAMKLEAPTLFGRRAWCLPVIVGPILVWFSKHRATFYTVVGLHVSTTKARQSSYDNFYPPLSFPMQNCKMTLNLLIVSNLIYLFFNFIHWLLTFYVFLSNLIIVLLIPIYFTFNLFFSDWILFFDFIPNHLILVHFFLLNLILILIIAIPLFFSSRSD